MRALPLSAAAALALLAAPAARADIALLANGQTMKVTAVRAEQGQVWLGLKEGGEIALPAAEVRGVVPDEFVEEVMAEIAAAPAGSDLQALATAAARRHDIDPALVLALVQVESAFQPRAVSPRGARGLTQLMPGTARELGVKDAFDPAQNLDGGARYLRLLLVRYGGDLKRALAAYNAGPGAVDRHRGVPPYRETRQYVRRVLEKYGDTKSE
ncbi:MAG TPA: lytic transglycosylase domain-containing protein [Vicinamibacteria bacterium]|nr:lytic transglycosylase domain-containing protein [Vicinamibacteria bacterium]